VTPVGQAPDLAPGQARRLLLDVSHRLDGLLQGDHLGYLPGPGTEPAEARTYVPGDDVRRMDWAVTARTGQPHVREATAERELETTLVVDLTASMDFGTVRWEKRALALQVAAAFAHLGSGPGDRVAAVVLTADGVRRLPPRGGRAGTLALLHTLLAVPRATGGSGPGLAEALAVLASPPRRRGVLVVVSDLLEPGRTDGDPAWTRPLRALARRHDVLVAEVVDPRELTLPDVGVLRLVDPESGRQLEVQTRSRRLRERYAAAAAARRSGHAEAVRAAGAGHVLLRTDEDWLLALARFLGVRRRTRQVVR
jgi:uncharacterized protein (DUF58 family)